MDVIFSIILTDDRFLSPGFHRICGGDKRKTDVESVCVSLFISFGGISSSRFQKNIQLIQRGIPGESAHFYFL